METNYQNFKEIMDEFAEKGVVVLNNFFSEESLKILKNKIKKLKFKKDFVLLHHSYQKTKLDLDLGGFLSEIKFKVLKLQWKDYMVLNDKYTEKPGVDVIIDITENWDSKNGGLLTYVDGSGDYLQIPASENSLAIVRRKKGTNKFIQYLNHYSEGKERIVLIGKNF